MTPPTPLVQLKLIQLMLRLTTVTEIGTTLKISHTRIENHLRQQEYVSRFNVRGAHQLIGDNLTVPIF